jgi:hypothetical protein
MNRPYLAYSIIVPPFFAVLKTLEKLTRFRLLVPINRILSQLDAFPSSLLFNLQTGAAVWQMVTSQLNDNQFTDYEIPDWSYALYVLGLAIPSLFVTLASLKIYKWLENKFSYRKLISGFFKVSDISAFFLENAVKLNAIGKMVIRLTTVFPLGGTSVEENPAKWFWTENFPSITGAIGVGAMLTYVAYRKKPLPLIGLGSQEYRHHLIERQRMIWTVIAINGYYWTSVYQMWQDPEGTKSDNSLIYLSAISTILLLLIPTLLCFGLFLYVIQSACSGIRDCAFKSLFEEPRVKFQNISHNIRELDSDSMTESLTEATSGDSETEAMTSSSSDSEIETISSSSSDSETEITAVGSNQGLFSYLKFPSIPSWLSIFGSKLPQQKLAKIEQPNPEALMHI